MGSCTSVEPKEPEPTRRPSGSTSKKLVPLGEDASFVESTGVSETAKAGNSHTALSTSSSNSSNNKIGCSGDSSRKSLSTNRTASSSHSGRISDPTDSDKFEEFLGFPSPGKRYCPQSASFENADDDRHSAIPLAYLPKSLSAVGRDSSSSSLVVVDYESGVVTRNRSEDLSHLNRFNSTLLSFSSKSYSGHPIDQMTSISLDPNDCMTPGGGSCERTGGGGGTPVPAVPVRHHSRQFYLNNGKGTAGQGVAEAGGGGAVDGDSPPGVPRHPPISSMVSLNSFMRSKKAQQQQQANLRSTYASPSSVPVLSPGQAQGQGQGQGYGSSNHSPDAPKSLNSSGTSTANSRSPLQLSPTAKAAGRASSSTAASTTKQADHSPASPDSDSAMNSRHLPMVSPAAAKMIIAAHDANLTLTSFLQVEEDDNATPVESNADFSEATIRIA